jgi:NAD dependent epimerase/dehydratase family enzyme
MVNSRLVVAITGGTGFIGRLVDVRVRRGDAVRMLHSHFNHENQNMRGLFEKCVLTLLILTIVLPQNVGVYTPLSSAIPGSS